MVDLSTKVAGVHLPRPALLASGIWGESGTSMAEAVRGGAGGVVTKSIGTKPREGYPNPTVEKFGDWGMLNAMGLPNPGMDEYPKEIAEALKAGAPVVGSIFGGDAQEFASLARRMEATGVHALELNLSCPHAKGYGSEIGQDPQELAEVVRAVKRATGLPVWAKITPNTHDPALLAEAAEKAGADAITAINTVRAMAIDPVLKRPVLAHGSGGLSGPAIKPIGLACVWQIFERVRIPIVGVGGISDGRDAYEYVLAGARALELGTAVATRGVKVFDAVHAELSKSLDAGGFPNLTDAVGAAHRR
ncbi:MAG: dihydroorotate dehydrogenase [Euryarchaeota archaeon]|nr:dihydroorotate dehydrogenase [Euryarchaeota archaeon]